MSQYFDLTPTDLMESDHFDPIAPFPDSGDKEFNRTLFFHYIFVLFAKYAKHGIL
jgi:hypothetical protein